MTSSGIHREWDLVVPVDGGELLAEFRRHGVVPGQRAHLRLVADAEPIPAALAEPRDLAAAVASASAAKRPPFRSPAGALAGRLPELTKEDFAAASRLAVEDAEASGTLSE